MRVYIIFATLVSDRANFLNIFTVKTNKRVRNLIIIFVNYRSKTVKHLLSNATWFLFLSNLAKFNRSGLTMG